MRKLIFSLILLLCLGFFVGNLTIAAEYDFGGETVTISGSDMVIDGGPDAYFEEGAEKAYLQKIEDKYNVKIEFKDKGFWDVEPVISSILSGEPLGDILYMHHNTFEPLAAEEVLYPLDDVLDEDYFKKLQPTHREQIKKYGKFAGVQYGFCSNDNLTSINKDTGDLAYIVWNKDMLEREGQPNVYDLYEEGKWTFDKMKEISKAVTKDTNGDGDIDQWGLNSMWGFWKARSILAFIYANDGRLTRENNFALNEENSLQAIQFLREMYTNGYIGNATGHYPTDFANGDLAFLLAQDGLWVHHVPEMAEEMEDDYGIVPVPRGPQADECVVTGRTALFALPINVEKDPEALTALANDLFKLTTDHRSSEKHLEKITHKFSMNARDQKSVEIRKKMSTEWKPLRYLLPFSEEEVWIDIYHNAIQGEKGVSETIDAMKPPVQAKLDEMLN